MDKASRVSWLNSKRAALIIVCLGFFIYANSLLNGFFADDYHQIVDNPQIRSLANIPGFFTGGTFYTGGLQLTGNYYRPVFAAAYAFIYSFSGTSTLGYHLVQLILYIGVCILLFYYLKLYFSHVISFLLSLIFLVHPINNEVVVYIANLQDTLFVFLGLLALLINRTVLPKRYFHISFLKPFIVVFLLLFAALTKETAVVFFLLLPLSSLISKEKTWRQDSIVSLTAGCVYLFMRLVIAKTGFSSIVTAPIMLLPLSDRLLHIPYVFFFYIKSLLFPVDLSMFHAEVFTEFDIGNFYLPLIFTLCLIAFLMLGGVLAFRSSSGSFKTYIFFAVWFLVGLLLHLQIFPLDATVAHRWFFLPFIGLLGMAGVVSEAIITRITKRSALKKSLAIAFVVVIVVLSIRVMVRNTQWKDQYTLIAHDIKNNSESFQLNEGYGLELMKQRRFSEAYPYLLRSTEIFPGVYNLTSLGVYYANTRQYAKAQEAFERAMQYDDHYLTYENYALLLLLTKNIPQAEVFSKKAVEKFPESYKLWLYLALSSYGIGRDTQAFDAALRTHELNPRPGSEYVIRAIQNKQKIDFSRI